MDRKIWMVPMTASVIVGLLVPWVAVAFLADAGLAVCLIQFYVLEPAVSAWVGWRAGEDSGRMWCLPLASACFFLLGTWLQFEMGEPAFLLYAGVYLLLGAAAMIISALLTKL